MVLYGLSRFFSLCYTYMLTRNPNRSQNPLAQTGGDAQIVAHDFADPSNPQPIWYVPEPPEDS